MKYNGILNFLEDSLCALMCVVFGEKSKFPYIDFASLSNSIIN